MFNYVILSTNDWCEVFVSVFHRFWYLLKWHMKYLNKKIKKTKKDDIPLLSERRNLPWTVLLQKGMNLKPISFLIAMVNENSEMNEKMKMSNVTVVLDTECPIVQPCPQSSFTNHLPFLRFLCCLIPVFSGGHLCHVKPTYFTFVNINHFRLQCVKVVF